MTHVYQTGKKFMKLHYSSTYTSAINCHCQYWHITTDAPKINAYASNFLTISDPVMTLTYDIIVYTIAEPPLTFKAIQTIIT